MRTTAPSFPPPLLPGDGLYVNGETLNVSGTVGIGTSTAANSSAQMRVDSGSVTAGGTTSITNTNGSRYSVLDVNGGSYTSTDTATDGTGGIQVGGLPGNGTSTGVYGELLIRGTGTVTTPTITLGNSIQTSGNDQVTLNAGSLYLGNTATPGSAGITTVQAAVESATPTTQVVALNGGLVGAAADWNTTVPITLGGAVTVQAAAAGGAAHNITINGAISGGGSINKTGGGTLTLTQANGYTLGTTFTAGTVAVNTSLAAGGGSAVGSGTQTFSGGTLQNANLTGSPTTNTQTTGQIVVGNGANSALDFGATNTGAVFSFASFSTTPSTGLLFILNDASVTPGVAGTGGGIDRLFFGDDAAVHRRTVIGCRVQHRLRELRSHPTRKWRDRFQWTDGGS